MLRSKSSHYFLLSVWVSVLPLIFLFSPIPVKQSGFVQFVMFIVVVNILYELISPIHGFIHRVLKNNGVSKAKLTDGTVTFLTCQQLYRKQSYQSLWMGRGFRWSGEHTAKLYKGLYEEQKPVFSGSGSFNVQSGGLAWMQALNNKCNDIQIPLSQFSGHSLLLATTRAIKTRFISLLLIQSIRRAPNEAVIVIDPKGDLELKQLLHDQAAACGREDDFLFFHPAFPEKSISINPLNNFSRSTELATRIVDIMKGRQPDDAFSAFSWRAVNVIVNGLLYINQPPDILLIKKYIEHGVGDLVLEVLRRYQRNINLGDNEQHNNLYQKLLCGDAENLNMKTLLLLYKNNNGTVRKEQCIDDLLSFYSHNKTHAAKMLAGLIPLLGQLSASPLNKLLSPSCIDCNEGNTFNMSSIISQRKILYIGLDSMTDPMVGAAIGQILLADIAAVAAKRYNYSQNFSRINIFIDEAHSVCSNSLLTLANQGAGAGIDLFLASQTLSDFVVALGSEEHALKLLGNLNNLFCGRVIDPWTQKIVIDRFGKTRIEQTMQTRSEGSGSGLGLMDWNSSWGERQGVEEVDLVPASVLGRMPNLEYFAMLAGGSLIKGKIPILLNE